jgi:hypothetical protein
MYQSILSALKTNDSAAFKLLLLSWVIIMLCTYQSIASVLKKNAVAAVTDLVPGSIITYTFNSTAISGITVKNIATGSFDLTMASPSTTSSQAGQEGDGCYAISTSGYATGSFSKTINISASTGITLSFWFKSINYNQHQQMVKLTVNGGAMWLNCDDLGNGTYAFYIYTGSNYSANTISASSTIFDGTWKHICVVIQNTSTIKWYVNNTLQTTYSVATPTSTSLTAIQLGDTTSGRTNGYFDGVRVYNSALTSTDVTTLYNGGVVN